MENIEGARGVGHVICVECGKVVRKNNRFVRTAAQVVHDSAPALLYVPCDKQMRVIKVVLEGAW